MCGVRLTTKIRINMGIRAGMLFATINRFSKEIDNPAHLWFGLTTKIWISMRIPAL